MINKYVNKSFGFLEKINNPLYLFSQNMSEINLFTLLYLVSLTLILFFRRPDALLNSQPWAEDGTSVFLLQVIEHSTHSIFITYAGYWHLIPRIITLIAIRFGLASAPFVMNLSALLISALCILTLCNTDFRFIIRNDFLRFLVHIYYCLPTIL